MKKFYYVVQVWDRSSDIHAPMILHFGPYPSYDDACEVVKETDDGVKPRGMTWSILEIDPEVGGKYPKTTTLSSYNRFGENVLDPFKPYEDMVEDDDEDEE